MTRRFPRSQPQRPEGLWRGEISRIAGTDVFVTIPRLSTDGREWGPVLVAEGNWSVTDTGSAGTDPHTHTSGTALAVGDRVVVGFVEGRANDVVLICRIA